jgi:hypothetical protein
VPHERLRRQFEKWWCELTKKFDEILVSSDVESIAGFKWLFLPDDIATIQARVDCKSIWVITSDLYKHSLRPAVEAVVQKNMRRDVVYTYIIPNSEDNDSSAQEFQRISTINNNHPNIQRISVDQFNNLAAADYIIVNPDCSDHYQLQMFLELPTESEDKYWIEVESKATPKFVARFLPLANGQSIKQQGGDS